MAIVGKGVSAISSYNSDFEEQLKNVINTNLISFLNVAANVKIINRNYQGENFGKVICQKMVYNLGSRQIVVISGIEKTFLIRVAEMIYGIDIEDEMDLVLYSMHYRMAGPYRRDQGEMRERGQNLLLRLQLQHRRKYLLRHE